MSAVRIDVHLAAKLRDRVTITASGREGGKEGILMEDYFPKWSNCMQYKRSE